MKLIDATYGSVGYESVFSLSAQLFIYWTKQRFRLN